ncbi:bifunctional sugar phosphate isomerase/epimerase/4-hydroxyphenylpyruvate dioxygenase family protein [Devosia rhizoryzae]|uniref:3-dehydroshikimate dehydratase n=1 Tax=Devosia rhizoryzae TaxID=2774137 RepID=A0ABX7C6Y4_9HYPH|nr:sugar phosphate isomerase/epimerase and 4-hydroxyphenylpyruvate domain-containing protein [Devosia rhizoryzae]QQR40027.1 sugar phosphate isomerase/epimerase and 4-hydroxyphenylpyruvate domain-containing protein [Devosia rhizoryzae]
MKTSIATVSISGDLSEKLTAIAAAGFDGVEIFENDFLTFGASARDVRQMAADLGLAITLFQPFRDFEGLPEPLRSRAFERAKRKFALMNELGTDLMLVCSNVSPAALGGIDRAAADFRELGELAAQSGVRVGFEALAWGRHVNDHRDAWEIVRRADHRSVGIILDSFHTLSRKLDPGSIRAIPGDKIFIVQLADAPLIDMDLLYWSRHFRNMPGEGDLPVVDFMRAVAATGYAGPLSLEIFNDQFRGGSPRAISVDGRRSLVYLMDQVRRLEPDLAITVPEMPERIEVERVEFVEFAADETEAARLAGMLTAMGFALIGKHRSKAVSLYRQGQINIVINIENDGLAYSSYVAHGTSAYAIGLKVGDAVATVERATALGASPFTQPVGDGELQIPAIRGVGGGVIYLLDDSPELGRVWEAEFNIDPAIAVQGAGLTSVDHVAQTMNYDEMLTWVLFYRSIFATQKSALVDVPDPSGLVRSQVIEDRGGNLRLTLNGAENGRTLAGHFVNKTFGSSIQHLAFATGDIFAASKAMQLDVLKVSDTYYDDIEARFGLDADFLDQLKAGSIFYDRDETGGEFFQFYSQGFGEGFFFEIVERRGGYSGYGAPNAPFRIAAQKQALVRGL